MVFPSFKQIGARLAAQVGGTAKPVGTASGPSLGKVATTKQVGDAAEAAALHHLQRAGLRLLERNYRTPGRGGGEIDLIMRAPDGTTVFVEVRQRASSRHGGAAASVSATKQRRIVFAARHYLMRLREPPPCRFDVVTVEPAGVQWLQAAFDADGA
jgi:putative endonuclease